jgi:hypothetical protein
MSLEGDTPDVARRRCSDRGAGAKGELARSAWFTRLNEMMPLELRARSRLSQSDPTQGWILRISSLQEAGVGPS